MATAAAGVTTNPLVSRLTTAGVSAGIDGALHVVDRLLGRKAAERTAHYMEYRWQPEAPAVEPATPERRALEAWHGAANAADWTATAEAYSALAAASPTDMLVRERQGLALARAGRFEEAIAAFSAAALLQLRPSALSGDTCDAARAGM